MVEPVRRFYAVPERTTSEQSVQLGARLRQLANAPNNRFQLERPRTGRPDQVGFFGPKKSKELQAHDRRMASIYHRAREAELVVVCGTAIEHTGFQEGVELARAYESKLAELDPESMTGTFAEMLALDSLARTRDLVTGVMGDFRSQTGG